ncbi:MAG TPA: DNA-directed RNA polymerase subunit beta [Candidatus Hydrogenedentes bacterium]|nr:DNA-directed RNA polymerase subunit beta [Candidatus Hydrogenedentota bacterium]
MAVAPERTVDRPYLGRVPDEMDLPNLIEIQTKSYSDFLQWDVPPDERVLVGLQEVFLDVFPIASPDGMTRLEFVHYSFAPPKYEIQECQERGLTYAASLKALLRLVRYEDGAAGGELREKMMVEQEVFLGELPVMTPTGTFIINGAERVIVSQLHKSPGVSFETKIHQNGKSLLTARIIPYRGAWLEFEYDINDLLWLTIDRRSKILATTFLRAFGYQDNEDILAMFYRTERVLLGRSKVKIDNKTYDAHELIGRVVGADVVDPETGEILADVAEELTGPVIDRIMGSHAKEMTLLNAQDVLKDPSIARTLTLDPSQTQDDAYRDIYQRIRPGDPATDATTRTFFQKLFFDPSRYDFAPVGRYKINRKLGLDISQETKTLTPEDVVRTMQYLVKLRGGEGVLDDIDHLGNRRVRAVGELLANQVRIGLVRMERTVRERMNFQEEDQLTPQTLVNPKPVSAVIKDFFGRSQLSHFMDQINPLAELTHKRRLSALGPGGLSRDRAGFEVRDVHPTHYGRICPIETPEGPNIGLMASLSTYARINAYGFLETPYRKVENGKVIESVEMLSAYDEDNYTIAQANEPLKPSGKFANSAVLCRHRGDFPKAEPGQVDYMDVSPKQLVSVAAALIPFLEHDDANRALMGSNMQRQAVPLLRSEAPLVGTGLEHVTARNSGTVVRAERSGVVEYVDGLTIRVRYTKRGKDKDQNPFRAEEDVYRLKKYIRSNQNTCINQRPIVAKGDKVEEGDIIADGPATDQGELALGRNVLVAFMPWEGYNFEDAILISEDMAKGDTFTSLHINVFELEARDTKLGPEEITRDIPNVSEEALRNLDETGIVRIGAKVKHGDILVGKVTPKGETELAPEEKLLRAIFGEKAEDVRDASLTVPPGTEGVIVDVKVCSRREKTGDGGAKSALSMEVARVKREYQDQIDAIRELFVSLVKDEMMGLKILEDVVDHKTDELVLEKGKKVKVSHLEKADYSVLARLRVEDKKLQQKLTRLVNMAAMEEAKLIAFRDSKIEMLRKGDELPPGVIKLVKVFVATKRRLSVGDKMAGRHGNKGVIAKILLAEDMPFLPDGTPVEIVLNPLGVPSRMNVGQILETHLGWAVKALGLKVATPVFNGASEEVIRGYLKKAGLPETGKIQLRDGRTGRPMDQDVTVGQIYMMKLNHLVDDKIHARAIGPYSLVTQQPLGGKAQFGGQRFGEMEVWALQAYGSAYTLQELLTIKSDDIQGRTKAYEAIVKGDREVEPGRPESFNVLVREMQSLCLDVIKLVRVENGGLDEIDEDEEAQEG